MAADLEQEIRNEEDRVKIHDPAHFAYSIYARATASRRDNLRRSADELRAHLAGAEKALIELGDELPEHSAKKLKPLEAAAPAAENYTITPSVTEAVGEPAPPEATTNITTKNITENIPSEEVGPKAEAPPAARTIEQQRDFIRKEVADQLIAAGRSPGEAQTAGAVIAARVLDVWPPHAR